MYFAVQTIHKFVGSFFKLKIELKLHKDKNDQPASFKTLLQYLRVPFRGHDPPVEEL